MTPETIAALLLLLILGRRSSWVTIALLAWLIYLLV